MGASSQTSGNHAKEPLTEVNEAEVPLFPTKGALEAEPPRRRFIARGIAGVLVPPAIAAYYAWTYVQFLRPGMDNDATRFDGTLLWWSWFVIGALGINVSTYVLADVEAGILTGDPPWKLTRRRCTRTSRGAGSADGCTMALHAIAGRRIGSGSSLSWLWVLLFLLQLLSWAFVLSGLTTETGDSFKIGRYPGVDVVGTNYSTFDPRRAFYLLEGAYQAWRLGQRPKVPLTGTWYSGPDTPNTSCAFNGEAKNRDTFPSNTKEPIFLSQQADLPLTGRAWGLALNYSCVWINNFTRLLRKPKVLGMHQSLRHGRDRGYKADQEALLSGVEHRDMLGLSGFHSRISSRMSHHGIVSAEIHKNSAHIHLTWQPIMCGQYWNECEAGGIPHRSFASLAPHTRCSAMMTISMRCNVVNGRNTTMRGLHGLAEVHRDQTLHLASAYCEQPELQVLNMRPVPS